MKYEIKTLPSGIIIENRPGDEFKYRWFIKDTTIFHNEGDPAIEYENGEKIWCQHDKYHRLDGPAVDYPSGNKHYHINGISYKEEDYWNHPKIKEYKYLKEHPELEAFV